MSNMFKPKVPDTPAVAAPTPNMKINKLRTEGSTTRAQSTSKRKGRSALRIDLQSGSAGAGGTGVNVPNT
jgi:hypothetical protein